MNEQTKQEKRILSSSFESISQNGIRNFTIDSFSQEIGMSKKTIYKFFPTKEKLINKTVAFYTSIIDKKFKSVIKSKQNAAVKLISLMEFVLKQSQKMPIEKVAELKNKYPKVWKYLEEFRLNRRDDFWLILSEGQQTGFIRPDIDVDIVATLYINIINSTFQPDFFIKNNLTPANTMKTFLEIITQGLFTKKGMMELENAKLFNN